MNMKRYLRIDRYPHALQRRMFLALETRRGRVDSRRLQKRFPKLRGYHELASGSRRNLLPYYEEYVSGVSKDDMAISLELSVFLTVICDVFEPKRILDLGSGFSSLVFRLCASSAATKPEVWSIDDSPKWLEETHDYLATNNLSTENLVSWSSFTEEEQGTFDLISHDLGGMDLRAQALEKVISLSRPGGKIILDDAHIEDYNSYARRFLKKSKLGYYSLKHFTEDKFGRYCILVVL